MDVEHFTTTFADDVASVKKLLDEKGVFYPVDFLIEKGFLSLREYLQWEQDRDRDYLENKVNVPTKELGERIMNACKIAANLSGHCVEYERIELGRPPMRDKEARTCFGRIYFNGSSGNVDGSAFMIANTVSNSLVIQLSGRGETLGEKWKEFLSLIPEWIPWRSELKTLYEAKEGFDLAANDLEGSLHILETSIIPIAKKVFGHDYKQFLEPILHTAKEKIEQADAWRDDPELILYNTIVSEYLGQNKIALGLLCELCWIAPQIACELMQKDKLSNKYLNHWWELFCDEDGLAIHSLPSYLLLKGYKEYDLEKADIHKAPEEFRITLELMRNPAEEMRKKLRKSNEQLFKIFMSQLQ